MTFRILAILAMLIVFALAFGVGLIFTEALIPGPWIQTGPNSMAERPGFTPTQLVSSTIIALVGAAFTCLVAVVAREQWQLNHPAT